MAISRPICALIATLAVGCTESAPTEIVPFVQSGKADGLPAHLHRLDDHKLHVDEPSDLLFTGGKLYTVSDAHSKIYEIDNDGDVKDEIDLVGEDFEALAIDKTGEFLVAEEGYARIWHVDRDGTRHDAIEVPEALDGNSGIEGLTFDHAGHMLIAKEKHPSRIIELGANNQRLADEKVDFSADISALTYNPDDHHVYALSDEDHSLYRLDSAWHVDTAWKLPIKNPEGVAFDGSLVYIASDSEQRLYLFELGN